MKEIIIAYINGVINTYNQRIINLTSLPLSETNNLAQSRDEFVAMLDFLDDLAAVENETEETIDTLRREADILDEKLEIATSMNRLLVQDKEELEEVIRTAASSSKHMHDYLFDRN
jgi:RNA processing factor Prp31